MKAPYKIVLIFFLSTCHQHPLVSGRSLDVPRPHKFRSRQRIHGDDMKPFGSSLNFHGRDNTLRLSLLEDRKSADLFPLLPLIHDEIGHSKSDTSITRDGNTRFFESIRQEPIEHVNLPLKESLSRKKTTDSTDSSKPTKPSKPTLTPKPTKPTKPPKPTKPTKPPKPTKPTKPPKPTKPTKPPKPTKPTKPPKPTKPTKPPKPTKPTKPPKPTKPTKPTKPPKPTKPSKPEIIESTVTGPSTTQDPFEAYCDVACETGTAGPECDCPGHPIG